MSIVAILTNVHWVPQVSRLVRRKQSDDFLVVDDADTAGQQLGVVRLRGLHRIDIPQHTARSDAGDATGVRIVDHQVSHHQPATSQNRGSRPRHRAKPDRREVRKASWGKDQYTVPTIIAISSCLPPIHLVSGGVSEDQSRSSVSRSEYRSSTAFCPKGAQRLLSLEAW